MSNTAWKNQKSGFQEALAYIKGRQQGLITSFKTPWPKVNDATTDGLEWGSTNVIAGRPGTGKSMIKDQLIREGVKLNCTLEEYNSARYPFRVLEFQLEMIERVSAIREFSSLLGKSYKYICSAGSKITDSDIDACHNYSKKRVNYPIDIVSDAPTVDRFESIITEYMEFHSIKEGEKKVYKNTVVTLDHSLLIKRAAKEDKYDMLYNLGGILTDLKRKYPIAFVVLSQLNRNVDSPERNVDGHYGNYILESDIFGADALLQHADIVIGLNRPGMKKIKYYGPDKYIIQNDKVLAMHFLKCRNGDVRISFFNAEYDKMKIVEMSAPPTVHKKI